MRSTPYRRDWWGLLSIVILCLGGTPTPATAQSGATLRGVVTSEADGRPLPNANVVLRTRADSLVRATTTDGDGYFEVEDLSPGRYRFSVSFVGFDPYRDTLHLERGRTQKRLSIAPASQAMDEVTVEARRRGAQREAGLQTVEAATVGRVPTPGPGGDLAAYLQTLPSVTSTGDRGGQLYVRGGTPSQNLVRVDGLSIVNPFHISGLYSAFPEEILQSADVYAGGFGAEYMGALSSVIDVRLRDGNMKQYAGSASVSPFIASAMVEGPIERGSESFLGLVRYSFIERTSEALTGQRAPLRFYDMTGRYSVQRENARCHLTGMHTFDRGRINPERETILRWTNTTIGGRCLLFGERLSHALDVSGGYTGYTNSAGTDEAPERVSSVTKGYFSLSREQDALGGQLRLGGRWEFSSYKYTLGEKFTALESEDVILTRIQGYASLKWQLGDRLTVTPSLGTQYHSVSNVPTYEPRLRASFRPTDSDRREVNVAFGKYKQLVEGITDERDAGSVFTIWTPAFRTREAPVAFHGLLGYRERIGSFLTVSVEGYGKQLRNIPVPRWSPVASFNTRTTPADGLIYGADVQVDVAASSFDLFLGYGWTSVTYRAGSEDLGAWTGGEVVEYSPAHDRRHQANVVASYEVAGVAATVSWEFGTGRPYTKLYGFDLSLQTKLLEERPTTSAGDALTLFDRPYGARLPSYHRLDVSLSRPFDLGAGVSLEANIGAINAYDRTNIAYYDVNTLSRVNQTAFMPYVSVTASIN